MFHGEQVQVLAVSETARVFFCWCSSDGVVLGARCGGFSLQHEVKTVQLLSTLIK